MDHMSDSNRCCDPPESLSWRLCLEREAGRPPEDPYRNDESSPQKPGGIPGGTPAPRGSSIPDSDLSRDAPLELFPAPTLGVCICAC